MPDPRTLPVGSLLEYGRIVRRRAWIILLTMVVAGGGAYLVAKRGVPVYQSHAEVLLRRAGVGAAASNGPAAPPDVDTEIRVLRGFAVRQAVLKGLPAAVPIAAASSTSVDSFVVSARSTDPRLAASSANAYANAYIDQRRTIAVNDLTAAAQQIQTKIADLQNQIDALGPAPGPAANGSRPTPTPIDVQRTALENQQANYRIQLNDLQLQLSNVSAGALVLTPAVPAAAPIGPHPVKTAGEAVGGGMVVGVGLAFLLEYLDDSVTSSETLERVSGDIPVLGVIPTVSGWRDRGRPVVTARTAPDSPSAEAYRYLRTSIRFLARDRPIKIIQITSPSPKDGKSTTVANLAVVLAQVGEKVIIVDLDLRRPRVHDFFALSNEVGFTSVVAHRALLSTALQNVPGIKGLRVLPAGPPPTNPSEVLSSARAAEVLATLANQGTTLLLDTSPLLPVTDASLVSILADATLLVTAAGLTKKHEVTRAIELLNQVHAPLVGVVLNRAPARPRYDYGSYKATAPAHSVRSAHSAPKRKIKRAQPSSTTTTTNVESNGHSAGTSTTAGDVPESPGDGTMAAEPSS